MPQSPKRSPSGRKVASPKRSPSGRKSTSDAPKTPQGSREPPKHAPRIYGKDVHRIYETLNAAAKEIEKRIKELKDKHLNFWDYSHMVREPQFTGNDKLDALYEYVWKRSAPSNVTLESFEESVILRTEKLVHLDDLFYSKSPKWQQPGTGKKVMDSIVKWCDKHGYKASLTDAAAMERADEDGMFLLYAKIRAKKLADALNESKPNIKTFSSLSYYHKYGFKNQDEELDEQFATILMQHKHLFVEPCRRFSEALEDFNGLRGPTPKKRDLESVSKYEDRFISYFSTVYDEEFVQEVD